MTNSVDLEKLGYIDLKRKILAAFVPLPIDNADLQTAQKAIEIAKKNSEDVTEAEALLKELKEPPMPTKDQVKTNN